VSEVLIFLLLIINLVMTIHLWQTVRRGPKKKFLKALLYSQPITPRHRPPPELHGIAACITDADRDFFADFEKFAEDVNGLFAPVEPWRLQELPDSELDGVRDTPMYGRRYEIFYNQIHVGTLQIHPFTPTVPTRPTSGPKSNWIMPAYCHSTESPTLSL
jgi:hypothetical protein